MLPTLPQMGLITHRGIVLKSFAQRERSARARQLERVAGQPKSYGAGLQRAMALGSKELINDYCTTRKLFVTLNPQVVEPGYAIHIAWLTKGGLADHCITESALTPGLQHEIVPKNTGPSSRGSRHKIWSVLSFLAGITTPTKWSRGGCIL